MVTRTANLIITSRMLVLQSKRIMLSNAKRRLSGGVADEQSRLDVERFETAVSRAHAHYNEAVLRLASPHTPQYRLIAYGSLIIKAERLRASLASAAGDMSHADRREVAADLGVLDSILESWRSVSRQSMTEAVA